MRFLIDNAMSPKVAVAIAKAGHDAVHVRELGLAAAADEIIFDRAMQEDRCVVSQDTDFGELLALRRVSKPSVILLRRSAPRQPARQAELLLANLPSLADDLEQGSIVVVEQHRIRIRRLPLNQ